MFPDEMYQKFIPAYKPKNILLNCDIAIKRMEMGSEIFETTWAEATTNINTNQDLERDVANLIRFGKVIGLIANYRIITLPIIGLLLINVCVPSAGLVVTAHTRETPSDLAWALREIFFYSIGSFVYIYMHTHKEKLKNVYSTWRETPRIPDKNFRKYVNIVTLCIMSSTILENAVYHIQLFAVLETASNCTQTKSNPDHPSLWCATGPLASFETYYHRAHDGWGLFFPFSPVLGCILFISNKLALYAWNWADVLIIVFCRAISFQFAQLKKGQVQEYFKLVGMLRQCQEFLAPLLFASYAQNTYALCIQIHQGLIPAKNKLFIESLYSVWSAVHLVVRMLLVSLEASRINDRSKQFVLHTPTFECVPVKPIAISALGFFNVTRNFTLHVFNVVFSVEIVLLQGQLTRRAID